MPLDPQSPFPVSRDGALAQQISDLRRRVDSLERQPAGITEGYYAAGAFSDPFVLTRRARVRVLWGGTGYAGSIGAASLSCTVTGAVTGVVYSATLPFFFNEANEHHFMGIRPSDELVLGADTYTVAIAGGAGLSRDANDTAFYLATIL